MSALVLDAGALVAVERDDRDVHYQVRDAQRIGVPVRTNAMAVAQAWRDGRGRQARLAKVLRGVAVESIIREDGLRAGELLGATRLKDAIDASVALLAGLGTGCSPAMLATCGGCVTPRETRPWWSIADGGDGVPARVRTRGAGTGGDRSIGLGR